MVTVFVYAGGEKLAAFITVMIFVVVITLGDVLCSADIAVMISIAVFIRARGTSFAANIAKMIVISVHTIAGFLSAVSAEVRILGGEGNVLSYTAFATYITLVILVFIYAALADLFAAVVAIMFVFNFTVWEGINIASGDITVVITIGIFMITHARFFTNIADMIFGFEIDTTGKLYATKIAHMIVVVVFTDGERHVTGDIIAAVVVIGIHVLQGGSAADTVVLGGTYYVGFMLFCNDDINNCRGLQNVSLRFVFGCGLGIGLYTGRHFRVHRGHDIHDPVTNAGHQKAHAEDDYGHDSNGQHCRTHPDALFALFRYLFRCYSRGFCA